MRICYISSAIYDYMTAALVEGLNALSRERRLFVVTSNWANYARRRQVWSRERILDRRKEFDLVILGTNMGADYDLYREMGCRDRGICVDGEDGRHMAHDPGEFRLYFKRELLEDPAGNIRPCSLAIERRWLHPIVPNPTYVLAACFGPTTEERRRVLEVLASAGVPRSHLGPIPLSRWKRLLGVLKGQCPLGTARRHGFAVGHNLPYYRLLRQSLVGLALPGAGFDTGRRWELHGAGAVVLAPRSPQRMPHPMVAGKHYIEYSTEDELLQVVTWVRAHGDDVGRMRYASREHCLRYHTSRARAAYVLDTFLGSANGRR